MNFLTSRFFLFLLGFLGVFWLNLEGVLGRDYPLDFTVYLFILTLTTLFILLKPKNRRKRADQFSVTICALLFLHGALLSVGQEPTIAFVKGWHHCGTAIFTLIALRLASSQLLYAGQRFLLTISLCTLGCLIYTGIATSLPLLSPIIITLETILIGSFILSVLLSKQIDPTL